MKAQTLIISVAVLLVLARGVDTDFKTYSNSFPSNYYPIFFNEGDNLYAELTWADKTQDLNIVQRKIVQI